MDSATNIFCEVWHKVEAANAILSVVKNNWNGNLTCMEKTGLTDFA